MIYIEIFAKDEQYQQDKDTQEALREIGIDAQVKTSQVYYIDGDLSRSDAQQMAQTLFADSLTQHFSIEPRSSKNSWIIEVRYKDAVSDPAQSSILKALNDLGKAAKAVRTARRHYLTVNAQNEREVQSICKKLLANDIIEDYFFGYEKLVAPQPRTSQGTARGDIERITLTGDLGRISKERMLSLLPEEMQAIHAYFQAKKRDPTDGELETIAQTWSEHCKHKTFNSEIELETEGKKEKEHISNLFKETIVAATNKLIPKKNWLVSVFKDNAGIIALDDKNNLAFKVETHNHPSALDPYGGASTGVGGVIRDVLGAGLGAKPIFNTDVFCFALPDTAQEKVPAGVLHPKRVFKGVISGVRDYGNRMGIPTVSGALVFDQSYLGTPLVYCGTGGIIPKGMERKAARPGDLIAVIGGRTGRDGLHGATFSSAVLDESSSSSAVQIGNPIEEKKMMDALLQARDRGFYSCVTDCGAGGFSSAIGEMGAEIGAKVELEKVPLKHANMRPWEIWMSESQERMVLAVPPTNLSALQELCDREEVELAIIGTFTQTHKLDVTFQSTPLVNLEMEFLHHGLPKSKRLAVWKERGESEEPQIGENEKNHTDDLLKLLAHPTIASKEEIIRRYDHEVQGNTIGKPLVGATSEGPADAAIIRTCGISGKNAVVIANGINPRYSLISTYWMAACAIDEALRNIIASGGDLQRTALLDNFCWGNTNEKEKLGSLVMAAKACRDIALAFETPFISGKDSLNNEYKTEKGTVAILETLLISAISVIDDASKTVSMDLKEAGNSLYIMGKTYDELGASYYYQLKGAIGKQVPIVRPSQAKETMQALSKAIRQGLVRSCHDCSEGGIAVAAAEMAFAGSIGLMIDAAQLPAETDKKHALLFSESNSRFLVEVKPEHEKAFEDLIKSEGAHTSTAKIGHTISDKKLTITYNQKQTLIDAPLDTLKNAWRQTLQW